MKRAFRIPLLCSAMVVLSPLALAREAVILPGVVGPVGVLSGVDTSGVGTLTVGNQDINTSNDAGGAITAVAANQASVVFGASSTVTGTVGTTGTTLLNVAAGANGNIVTFNGPVFSTTFSLSGTGTVNFNGGFTSNTGSTMDFAGDGFINVGAGQTVLAAITNSAGASTGTLTLGANSVLDGAVGAASGLKMINVVGGNALITGQANSAAYSLGTNTLSVAGAFAIPVAGVINTTIFSQALYGQIVPVGFATIGNALQINVTVTGPIANGTSFNIINATSGTSGSTVIATDNTLRYAFSASPSSNGLVTITTTQIPLAVVIAPVVTPPPGAPAVVPLVVAPVVDALPVTPETAPLLTPLTLLPDPDAIADALAQLGPGASGFGSPLTSFGVTQRFQDLWASHLAGIEEACGDDGQGEDRKRDRLWDDTDCQPNDRQSHLWLAGFGNFAEQDTGNGFEGYDSDSLGAMLAYDVPFGETMHAGAGIRYARSTVEGKVFNGETDIDSYQATAYLGYAPGNWFANAALVYGLDSYSGTRSVAFPGFAATATSDYDGDQFTVFGATGYHFYIGDGRSVITPIATLQYTMLHADAYTETGGGAINLNVNAQDYDFVQSGLGVKAARYFPLSDRQVLRVELHGNWLHSFGDGEMTNTAAFTAGGPAFTLVGLSPDEDTRNMGMGITAFGGGAWSVEGSYDYQWRNDAYSGHQGMLKFVMRV